ncbi:MAG: hypothetical protein ACRC76_03715 [Proteocatella sp.]
MDFQKLTLLREDGQYCYLTREVTSASEYKGQLVVNELIALAVKCVSQVYIQEDDIEIKDSDGNFLGMLCFSSNINRNINELTIYQYVAFLAELEIEETINSQINNHYVVLKVDCYDDYMDNYYSTAPLWGRFSHGLEIVPPKHLEEAYICVRKIKLPSIYHSGNCLRAINEPYAFERYLKYYHLLELHFDYHLVEAIKQLGDDLLGVGEILKNYKREDMERLKKIITLDNCKKIGSIAKKLNEVKAFQAVADNIFNRFGKENNPLKDNSFNEIIDSVDGFADERQVRQFVKKKTYEECILAVAIYWIYRVRCCIAHNKIGEYVMVQSDEEFVAKFAEPLLHEVVIQVFEDI